MRALVGVFSRGFASRKGKGDTAKLRQQLDQWSDAYYNAGDSPASDEEYDRMRAQLEALEGAVADVGAPPAAEATRFVHRAPMLSLDSTRNVDELAAFFELTRRAAETDELQWVTEIKYDGMALALHYDAEGLLRHVVTRGDGKEGEELPLGRATGLLASVPKRINTAVLCEPCEVRGEVLLSRSRFEPLRDALGYRSARNAVAGILRNENPPPGLVLDFVAYGIESDKTRHANYTVRVELLQELGFATCPRLRVHRRWQDGVEAEVQAWLSPERRRTELPYEADGMVIKLDSRRLCDALGSTRHHPRHSLAFKWSERHLPRTTIERVEWSVDQSGHLRPVAVVQPVQWEDSAVLTRASLHNWAFVARHALAPGSEAELERSGGTVPRLVPLPAKEHAVAERPLTCPCALQAPVEDDPPLHLRCGKGVSCPQRVAYRAYAVAAALGVKGLGLTSAVQLAEAGLLTDADPWAVLRLTAEQLLQLGSGWGPKKAENLMRGIASAVQSASFVGTLSTLGVTGVGPLAWSTVAAAYSSLRLLAAASAEQLATLPDVGVGLADLIHKRVNPDTVSMLEKQLQKAGLPIASSHLVSSAAACLALRGASVVVTGTFSVPRAQLAAQVRAAGGSLVAALSRKTTVLVAGRDPTPAKLEKAERLQVPVESEEEFRKRFD